MTRIRHIDYTQGLQKVDEWEQAVDTFHADLEQSPFNPEAFTTVISDIEVVRPQMRQWRHELALILDQLPKKFHTSRFIASHYSGLPAPKLPKYKPDAHQQQLQDAADRINEQINTGAWKVPSLPRVPSVPAIRAEDVVSKDPRAVIEFRRIFDPIRRYTELVQEYYDQLEPAFRPPEWDTHIADLHQAIVMVETTHAELPFFLHRAISPQSAEWPLFEDILEQVHTQMCRIHEDLKGISVSSV